MKSTDNDSPKLRLQVFLSRNGVCSRRDAMELVQSGRVKLNGKVNLEPSSAVDPARDTIEVDGKRVGVKGLLYVMLHKPAGYVTTKEDKFAEKLVTELLPADLSHLNPIGRLDKNTEGLLLFTNDGELLNHLTHPRFHVEKVYEVIINGTLKDVDKKKLETGIDLEGKETAPAHIDIREESGGRTHLSMKIHEGRKRQIRLMFGQFGYKVVYLKRVAQGALTLGALKKGRWRYLTEQEVRDLKRSKS